METLFINNKKRRSFAIVEIILATSILSILSLFIVSAILYSQESTIISSSRNRALDYAYEGVTAVENIKKTNFNSIEDGIYGIDFSNGYWELIENQDNFDEFTRQITISTLDNNTKEINSIVTWNYLGKRELSVNLNSIITNWEKVLSTLSIYSYLDISKNKETKKIDYKDNSIFLIESGANPNFMIIDKTDPQLLSEISSTTLSGKITDMVVDNTYIYFSSTDKKNLIQILDISSQENPVENNNPDLTFNSNPNSIVLDDTNLYVGFEESKKNNEIYVLDIFDKNNVSELSSINVESSIIDLYIKDNYLYAITDDPNNDLLIIDISNPLNIQLSNSLNLINDDYTTITGLNNHIFLGDTNGNLYVMNIDNPTNPQLISTYQTEGQINEIRIIESENKLLLSTSSSLNEFQVLDISDISNISLISGFNAEGNIISGFYDEYYFISGDLPNTDILVLED